MLKRLAITFLGITSGLTAQEMRVWTDVQNRKLTASYIKTDDTNVYLKSNKGKDITYPIEKLSAADQDFIKLKNEKPSEKSSSPTSALNFSDPFPPRVELVGDPEVKTIEENPEKKTFIYESSHYQYICDVRLANSVVRGFALLFEATYESCKKLPLGMNLPEMTKEKHKIQLFEKFSTYVDKGGPPSSAGVFRGDTRTIMVPLTSLGVKPVGSGYMLDRDHSNKTLAHEIVHQLTPEPYYAPGSMGWFTEGLAEYVSTSPYRAGAYQFRNNGKTIITYVTAYGKKNQGGRAIGETIEIGSLDKFIHQDYGRFLEQPQLNYGVGLLLTYYFLHIDGNGDSARLKEFLKTLHETKDGDKALVKLLDGRDYATLQKEITKGLKKEGVELIFSNSGE